MISASLLSKAEEVAARLKVDAGLLDFLYSNSRWQPMSRTDWEKDVRFATAINHVLKDALDHPTDLDSFLDQEAKHRAIDKLKAPHGLLMMISHGGFTSTRRGFYRIISKEVRLGRLGKAAIGEDQRQAMFVALRTLQDGGAIVMAPDGPQGQQLTLPKTILGKTWHAGKGAGFLATASGCVTAWYSMAFDGKCFVPQVDLGPQFKKGMTADEFSNRLYCFYADRIESILTGDPRNIVLRPGWIKKLGLEPSANSGNG